VNNTADGLDNYNFVHLIACRNRNTSNLANLMPKSTKKNDGGHYQCFTQIQHSVFPAQNLIFEK